MIMGGRKLPFIVTVNNYGNSVPEEIVNAPRINSLKNRIDKNYEDKIFTEDLSVFLNNT